MYKRICKVLPLMLSLLLLTACAQQEAGEGQDDFAGATESGSDAPMTENNSPGETVISWSARYYQLADQYDYVLAADRLYGCAMRQDQVTINIYAIHDKQELSAEQTLIIPDVSSAMGMASDREGNVYLMGNKGRSIGLWRLDTTGNLPEYVEIEPENAEGVSDFYLYGLLRR